MSLMHSEYNEDQDKYQEVMESFRDEVVGRGDQPALDYVDMAIKGARAHSFDIREFGGFPHRHECLGRVTAKEEQVFMDAGGNKLAPKKEPVKQ
jgi:uncharacterized protein (DUF924 family)|tara:strand:- start:516 stop:797 length:282 start_codon:yes stop_codon:yes gene_type:complete